MKQIGTWFAAVGAVIAGVAGVALSRGIQIFLAVWFARGV
jgi:hypothetical protein